MIANGMAEWPMLILTSKIQAHVWREQSPVWVRFLGNNDKPTRMPLPRLGKATFFKTLSSAILTKNTAGSEGSKPAPVSGPATNFKNHDTSRTF